MNVGLIARCDSTGLGIQSVEFFKNIPCKALVIDFSAMAPGLSDILRPRTEQYPGQTVFKWGNKHNLRGDIPTPVINDFLDGLDVVFAMETPYDYNIFQIARARGIKTVLQFNYEFLDFPSALPAPDLFAAPSMWNYNLVPDRKKFLPVPICQPPTPINKHARTFVHIAGRPAANDRNGTQIFLQSLEFVQNEIIAVVRSQRPVHIPQINNKKVRLVTDFSNKSDRWENYHNATALVLPRKYGGLCLPINEAIGCGIPVIAPNISPNNTWLPSEWLVPAEYCGSLQSKRKIEMYECRPEHVARKIDEFCDTAFHIETTKKVYELNRMWGWEQLKSKYYEACGNL